MWGTGVLSKEKEGSLSPVCMKRSWKQIIKKKSPTPSALNKTTTHFFSELQRWLALESALNQSVHPSWAAWHAQGLPLTSGALSRKLFWPQKRCLRSLPSQGPTSTHSLLPLFQPWLRWSWVSWNSQMTSLMIIFKGSFGARTLTFISPPNLLPFFVGSPHSFSLPPQPPSLIWRSLTR